MEIINEIIEIREIYEPIYTSPSNKKRFEGLIKTILKMKKFITLPRKISGKLVSTVLTVALVINMANPLAALAIVPPEPLSTPSAPSSPSTPTSISSSQNTLDEPSSPSTPSAPVAPDPIITPPPTITPLPTSTPTNTENLINSTAENTSGTPNESTAGNTSLSGNDETSAQSEPTISGTGGQNDDSNVGGSSIKTGTATNNATLANTGNTNSAGLPSGSGGATVVNSGNGSDSSSDGSVALNENNVTDQDNSATVVNNLDQDTTTGKNSASRNTGGDNTIESGDANTTGTIINSLNTNLAGVSVYEFNIIDDYNGNYVLDLSSGNCVAGCSGGSTAVINEENGSNSENNASVDQELNNSTFQENDADIENNMTLASNSGDNRADRNTGGDNTVTTGDANTEANVLNFVNNNLAGGVVLAVVNIFGDLVGDILLPDGSTLSCCINDATVANKSNGDSSDNDASLSTNTNNDVEQFNNADIDNNLYLSAETGDNAVSSNTNGNNKIATGDSSILASVVNFANNNIVGGNWWLVIVNEGGKWIGKILGAPDGSNMYGSEGLAIYMDENGEIYVSNEGNGEGSVNNANVTQDVNNDINQSNNANIVNNLNLSANTGGNSASRNTGGSSTIVTGDASIIANIINFVNNNIIGDGNLFVTVINVFGSWMGDFVSPGQEQQNHLAQNTNENGVGGSSSDDVNSVSSGSESESPKVNTNSQSEITVKNGGIKNVLATSIASSFSDEGDNEISMSGGSENDSVITADKKVVKINLAWGLLGIPLFGIYLVLKRNLLPKLARK